MDNPQLLERIESGELKIEDEFDGIRISVEVEAVDQLGLLLRRVIMETQSPARSLRDQARAAVEKLTYLPGGTLKVIEVDGVSSAVQIRSGTAEKDGFVEVLLRGGNRLSLEKRPEGTIHLSKGDFKRLMDDLGGILR
jgi:hypothetical protein